MSLASKQITKIADGIVEKFIKTGFLPHFGEVSRFIAQALRGVEPGRPSLIPRLQGRRKVFRASTFNDNLDLIVNDIELLNEEQIDQVVNILAHFNAGEAEYRKISKDIRKTSADIARLLLEQRNTRGYLYSLGDNFSDTSKIDLSRTTVELDPDERAVRLPTGGRSILKLPLTHLRGDRFGNFKLIVGSEFVASQRQTPNGRFGNMFDDINKIWKQQIFTTRPIRLSGTFSFKLNADLSESFVNRISITTQSPKSIRVLAQYRNRTTGDWIAIPTSAPEAFVSGKHTWIVNTELIKRAVVDVDPTTNPTEQPNPITPAGISELRFVLTKDEPDTVVDDQYLYEFGIRNISVYFIGNRHEAELVSTSLGIEDIAGIPITINQLSVQVDEDVPHGTNIEYYIGLDRILPIQISNPSGHITDYTNPEGTVFASGISGTQPGILESQLREWAIRNEQDVSFNTLNYRFWEPNWIKIRPIFTDQRPNASGIIGPDILKFDHIDTISDDAAPINDRWSASPPIRIQNINYYDIFRFGQEPIPDTLSLWMGKSSWIHKIEKDAVIQTIQGSGRIQDLTSVGEFPFAPLVIASGTIIDGSVTRVRPFESLEVPEGFYRGEAPHPEYFTQVRDNKLWIARNEALAENEIAPGKRIAFDYKVRKLVKTDIWETNVFLAREDEATVSVSTGGAKRISVSNLDSETDFEVGSAEIPIDTGVVNLNDIGQGHGWYRLVVEVLPGSTYIPHNIDIIGSGVQHFAIRQPAHLISSYGLLNDTHKYDHARCAMITRTDSFGQETNVLRVNDITEPSGSIEFFFRGRDASGIIDANTIYSNARNVADFYDIRYQVVTEPVTNLLFKSIFRSDVATKTPTLREYTVNIGNELRGR